MSIYFSPLEGAVGIIKYLRRDVSVSEGVPDINIDGTLAYRFTYVVILSDPQMRTLFRCVVLVFEGIIAPVGYFRRGYFISMPSDIKSTLFQ
jgi:hypothetical protein